MSPRNYIGGYIRYFFLEIESQTCANGDGERLVGTECFDGTFIQGVGNIWLEVDADQRNDIDLDTCCTAESEQYLFFI